VGTSCPACESSHTVHAFQAPDLALGAVTGHFSYQRCQTCASVFAAPQLDDASLAAAYANSYGNYQATPSLVEQIAAPLAHPEVRRFMRHANGGGELIELGAGNGRFLERLRHCGWTGSLQGVEFDEGVAAATTARTGLQVRAGDLNHEVLPEKSYDAIVMRHVIEHLRQPTSALEMVSRALRPGGLLYLGTPDTLALSARVFGQYWWGYEVPRHLVIFSASALSSVLERVGFELVDRWSGFSPQMWSASLGLFLAEKQVAHWKYQAATSLANPITMTVFSMASAIEVALGRSTMLCIVARRIG
jgi:SAM-dependent methyltransferase